MLAQRVPRPRIIQPFRVTRKPCKSYLTILEGRARFHWNVFMVVVLKGDIFILDDWLIDPNRMHSQFLLEWLAIRSTRPKLGKRFVARIWKTPHKQVVAKDRATNICRSRSVGVSTWSLEEHGESHTCRSAMWCFCNSMLGCKEKVAKAFFLIKSSRGASTFFCCDGYLHGSWSRWHPLVWPPTTEYGLLGGTCTPSNGWGTIIGAQHGRRADHALQLEAFLHHGVGAAPSRVREPDGSSSSSRRRRHLQANGSLRRSWWHFGGPFLLGLCGNHGHGYQPFHVWHSSQQWISYSPSRRSSVSYGSA